MVTWCEVAVWKLFVLPRLVLGGVGERSELGNVPGMVAVGEEMTGRIMRRVRGWKFGEVQGEAGGELWCTRSWWG